MSPRAAGAPPAALVVDAPDWWSAPSSPQGSPSLSGCPSASPGRCSKSRSSQCAEAHRLLAGGRLKPIPANMPLTLAWDWLDTDVATLDSLLRTGGPRRRRGPRKGQQGPGTRGTRWRGEGQGAASGHLRPLSRRPGRSGLRPPPLASEARWRPTRRAGSGAGGAAAASALRSRRAREAGPRRAAAATAASERLREAGAALPYPRAAWEKRSRPRNQAV